jgi:hypothetical protein
MLERMRNGYSSGAIEWFSCMKYLGRSTTHASSVTWFKETPYVVLNDVLVADIFMVR